MKPRTGRITWLKATLHEQRPGGELQRFVLATPFRLRSSAPTDYDATTHRKPEPRMARASSTTSNCLLGTPPLLFLPPFLFLF